jgi:DNA-binding response OmpR family regulator
MQRGGGMKKILVVEDDAVSARMLRDYLDAHGYATTIATTGIEGLRLFRQDPPDLMIVDVALPMKSGFEVCFEVKRTVEGRALPVLLMSAVYQDAQGWLSKPFELRTLLTRVEQLIGTA